MLNINLFSHSYNDPKTKHLLEVWKCLSFKYLVPNTKHALNAKIIYNEINNDESTIDPPPPSFFFSFFCTLLVLCCRGVDSSHLICSFDCFVVGRWRLNSARTLVLGYDCELPQCSHNHNHLSRCANNNLINIVGQARLIDTVF